MINFEGGTPNFDLEDADELDDLNELPEDSETDAPEKKTLADYSKTEQGVMYAFYGILKDEKKVARKFNVSVGIIRALVLQETERETGDIGAAPEQLPAVLPRVVQIDPEYFELDQDEGRADAETGENEQTFAPPISYDRPYPPEFMRSPLRTPERFVPAPELNRWFRRVFIHEAGPLYNENLWYFALAKIGFLWTNVEKKDKGDPVGGTAEIPLQSVKEAYALGRARQQYLEWFGCVPDFVIHIDSVYAGAIDDRLFCSLIFHEVSHCGFKADVDTGEMKMKVDPETKEEKPMWRQIKHHVEEFVTAVELFGVEACAGRSVDFVAMSHRKPKHSDTDIARACGRIPIGA